jgi:2-dehydropantoate 2-reductase
LWYSLDLLAAPWLPSSSQRANREEIDMGGEKSEVAIVGPGAIGCVVAAWLVEGGHEVTVCARTPFADLVIETPDGPLRAHPRILTDPAAARPVDWVLVATKAYDVAATAPWLAQLMGDGTRVAVLQNGVTHIERFRPLVAEARIVPVVVDIPANRTAPGRVTQGTYGTLFAPAGRNGDDFAALFAGSRISAVTDADFASRLWSKLCLNAVGAVSTLTLTATGQGWSAGLERLVRAIADECAAVARAEGATIPPAVIEMVMDRSSKARPGGVNSMHADRLAGRPMEIEERNGVIVRLGRKHGIPTPVSELIVELLRAIRPGG